MRKLAIAAVFGLAAALQACSDPVPPLGKWQGAYEGAGALIVARLEIEPGGLVRVSAPNAFAELQGLDSEDRKALRRQLAAGLDAAWPGIAPTHFSFDGRIFRKPGGVAPQIEWHEDSRTMTLIVYPGLHETIRVPLEPVAGFTAL